MPLTLYDKIWNEHLVYQQEDGSKIFTEEDFRVSIPSFKRLCGVGLHDLILEEEGILQEAVDQIKLEDFTLDNITKEDDIIGDFVPFLGWESHAAATAVEAAVSAADNMQLESTTHKTENACVQTENGDLIGQEDDEESHIVLDDFYFKYYSEGTITQTGTTITGPSGESYYKLGAGQIEYDMTCNATPGFFANADDDSIVIYLDPTDDGIITVTLHEELIKPFEDGAFVVIVDNQEMQDFTQVGNTLTIPCVAGTEKTEIHGSWAIPEFGVIAGVILAVAIASIIAVSAKSRLALVPKY